LLLKVGSTNRDLDAKEHADVRVVELAFGARYEEPASA
jgi:hypothetical protein